MSNCFSTTDFMDLPKWYMYVCMYVSCNIHHSLPLEWSRQHQFTPSDHLYLGTILILFSHLFLGLTNCLFRLSDHNSLYHSHLLYFCPCLTIHLPWFCYLSDILRKLFVMNIFLYKCLQKFVPSVRSSCFPLLWDNFWLWLWSSST
jgi:hypothetical protein